MPTTLRSDQQQSDEEDTPFSPKDASRAHMRLLLPGRSGECATGDSEGSTTDSRSWLRKRFPRLWTVVHVGQAWWSFFRESIKLETDDVTPEEKSKRELESWTRLFAAMALFVQIYKIKPREGTSAVQRVEALRSQAEFEINYSPSLILLSFLPDLDLAILNMSKSELGQAIRRGESALRAFEEASRELKNAPRSESQFAGRFSRYQKAARAARHALLHVTLAGAYGSLNEGDVAQNLDSALAHYESALAILKQEDLPELSAMVLYGVATLHLFYPSERRDIHARRAAAALEDAKAAVAPYAPLVEKIKGFGGKSFLKTFPKFLWVVGPHLWNASWRGVPSSAFARIILPEIFAGIDWGLGIAYRELGTFDKARAHFSLALETLPLLSEDRAAVQVSLGLTYIEAQSGDRTENLTCALRCFGAAMDGSCDEATFILAMIRRAHACLEPEAMAVVKPEDREEDLAMLVDVLRDAAQGARSLTMPLGLQEALFLLGRTYVLGGDCARAWRALTLACRVAERMHTGARTPRLKRYLLLGRTPLYELLVRTALAYSRVKSAGSDKASTVGRGTISRSSLRIAEKARTEFLREHLATRALLPKGSMQGDLGAFFDLRRQWVQTELRLLELETTTDSSQDSALVEVVRRRRDALESRYLNQLHHIRTAFADPLYDPDQPVSPARFAEISSMVNTLSQETDTALVEYYMTDERLVVFVVLPVKHGMGNEPAFLDAGLSRADMDSITERWSSGYRRLRNTDRPMHPSHWERGYLLPTLDRLRRAVEIPAKIIETWERKTHRHIARIVVVPHRFLHLVPLHAVPLSQGKLWGESVSIQYAPSASVLLHLLQSKSISEASPHVPSAQDSESILAVSYARPRETSPSEVSGLLFTGCEVQAVLGSRGGAVLEGSGATPSRVIEAMRDATHIHFACHGMCDYNTPLQGGLELAPEHAERREGRDHTRLTLGEIFERVRLPRARLVVLSACDSGIPEIEESRDEYLGLPAGFLYAGARTVVSTLWPVTDLSAWLLMREMAREITSGSKPSEALHCAQHRLRRLSADQISRRILDAASVEKESDRQARMIKEGHRVRERSKSEAYPFASPYWWAGFTVNGIG